MSRHFVVTLSHTRKGLSAGPDILAPHHCEELLQMAMESIDAEFGQVGQSLLQDSDQRFGRAPQGRCPLLVQVQLNGATVLAFALLYDHPPGREAAYQVTRRGGV
jgi:hypothetical protein